MAAIWHASHATGAIEDCPLCGHSLEERPDLQSELESLRKEGESAYRTLGDNVNAISIAIENTIPQAARRHRLDATELNPWDKYKTEARERFVSAERYGDCLVGIAKLVDDALASCPQIKPTPAVASASGPKFPPEARPALDMIFTAEALVEIARWTRSAHSTWVAWWNQIAAFDQDPPLQGTVAFHLVELDKAVTASAPYRAAATALREAWKEGTTVAGIDEEQMKRQQIADALTELKDLKKLVDAEVRGAIEGLSSRMGEALQRVYIVERLRFHSAQLERRTGLTVRGSLAPEITIDATLVANTSWLRALLWSFLFALREEALEQLGHDAFPLLVLDDPQATFDTTHRHRWAQHIAALQKQQPSSMQVLLTTHDSPFAEELHTAGVTGRRVQLVSAGPELGGLYLIEGGTLDRSWQDALSKGTQKAAADYIADVRVHVESMLKVMMRGEIDPLTAVIGSLREKLHQLHNGKIAPWNRPMFRDLAGLLDKNKAEVKNLESSHHATGSSLGMTHAADVQKFWHKDLEPKLNSCFKAAREYRLLHGESKALYAAEPTAVFPPGHPDAVRNIPLQIHGNAAALTNGRMADGSLTFVEVGASDREKVVLGRHDVFRIACPRLEPVARTGDLVIVAQDSNPPPGSLVVALVGDQLLARRFHLSIDHPDVAVLTAQANNPKDIAPPVVAHLSTIKLRKIIGVLFDPSAGPITAPAQAEVVDCGGDAAITQLKSGTFGLVKISGDSAQPQALDGQFLLVKTAVAPEEAFRTLEGAPVIATDSDHNNYFKRLRIADGQGVILESLDSSGGSAPVFLSMPGQKETSLDQVWPVAGVLFERPN